jgi:peptide deformylase
MTVGLSANQVGIKKRISIVDLAIGRKGYSDLYVLINPEITWFSKTMVENCEGCVNLPTIWGYVKRSKKIKVRALDRSGNELELTLNGWSAILLQHEIDHLNGKLFIDKLDDPKKAHLVEKDDYQKYKTQKKLWKKYIDVSDLINS